jgi:hypothetical protein
MFGLEVNRRPQFRTEGLFSLHEKQEETPQIPGMFSQSSLFGTGASAGESMSRLQDEGLSTHPAWDSDVPHFRRNGGQAPRLANT